MGDIADMLMDQVFDEMAQDNAELTFGLGSRATGKSFKKPTTMTLKTMHRTRIGQVMPIAEMTDSHLLNTVQMLLNQAIDLRLIGEAPVKQMSEFELAFNDGQTPMMNPEQAGRKARNIMESCVPYVFELVLRGKMNDDLMAMAQQAMGRKAIERSAPTPELP